MKTREVKTREEANAEKNPNHKTEALATMKRRIPTINTDRNADTDRERYRDTDITQT